MLEDDGYPAVGAQEAQCGPNACGEALLVVFLSVAAFTADDGLVLSGLIRDTESQPMVPKYGKVEVTDESAIRRICEDIVNCARIYLVIQCGSIRGKHPETAPAVKRLATRIGLLAVPLYKEYLFLGSEDILKSTFVSL